MQETSFEVNFDGLVGPTHNYAGLSYGNIASVSHKAVVSNPQEAALQGLKKMKELSDMGFKQALLPPHERPHLPTLRRLGFSGTDAEVIEAAWKSSRNLVLACSSASSMWTANAATVAPRVDTADHKTHFTAANLMNKFHRSLEGGTTSRILRAIFKNERFFAHHDPLPSGSFFDDEGAANHTRFSSEYGKSGIHFFVFGRSVDYAENFPAPKKFPARQTLEASQAIARLHRLDSKATVFAQQNPDVIDVGAFHNDVVAVGNRNVIFYHELAFARPQETISELSSKFQERCQRDLIPVEVKAAQVSVHDAVKSYLFNSQLLSLDSNTMILVAPRECEENPAVSQYLRDLIDSRSTPIQSVRFFDLRQSMQNGGGPACLRLRVVLSEEEIRNSAQGVFIQDQQYATLCQWVKKHYRDRLTADDFRDPQFLMETHTALDELTRILALGSIYEFQQ